MRMVVLAVALSLGLPVSAQDKAPKKKQAKPAAHKKASSEQIRKFNELAKKRQEKL